MINEVLEKLVGHFLCGSLDEARADLCQLAADACNRPVVAGPVEATAIGNVLMQAVALGDLKSTADLREVVRNSFSPEHYEPKDAAAWDEAYERYTRTV